MGSYNEYVSALENIKWGADTDILHKFGQTTNADSGVTTDIWDGANPTDDIAIWIAPTTARVHGIVSSDINDSDSGGVNPQSTGARTIRVYGLTSWSTPEITEDIIMDGTTSVNTVNSFVAIYRMKVITSGEDGPNLGVIKATAAVDNTTTAVISAGNGQTLMSIMAIPSGEELYLEGHSSSAIKSAGSSTAEIRICVNETPNVNEKTFLVKHVTGLSMAGTSTEVMGPETPWLFKGPCIIKMQANSNTNNLQITGQLNGFIRKI